MPLLRARNADITVGRQETYLTASAASGAGTLTVQDISGFAIGNYLLLGKWGEEGSEIVRIHASTAPSGTTITLAANTAYAHGVTTPVTFSPFNRVEFSYASTATGSKSVLTTAAIQADELFTTYDDTSNSSGYGFVRFNHQANATFSSYSGAVNYGGYNKHSLFKILELGRALVDEPTQDLVKDDELILVVNHKQRDIALTYPFFETTRSTSSVANQQEYSFASNVHVPRTVTYRTYPLAPIPLARFEDLMVKNVTPTSDSPRYAAFWGGSFRVWPASSSSAQTTALNGALTATATTITVDATTGFESRGRIIVDSEVITYTGTSTTTLTGCTRGAEGTTAATHSDDATVTARDIVVSYSYVPDDLNDFTDETDLKDAEIFAYAVAEHVEQKRGNAARAQQWAARYLERLGQLKDRYGQKQALGFMATAASEDVHRDVGVLGSPDTWWGSTISGV